MRRGCHVVLLFVSSLVLVTGAPSAQEATERFIPIGQSPGVSGVSTMLGEVVSVDRQNQSMTVLSDGQRHRINMGESTRIWLDRSESARSNVVGRYQDMRAGDTVEIRWRDRQLQQPVEWIKVRHSGP